MLLSVVSTKTATSSHQILEPAGHLGRVICRSFHSSTPDFAKPSSQRRDLEQAAPMAAYLAALFLLYAVMVSGTSMSGVTSSNGAYPKLKQFCRVATRFEKPPVNYRPVATVAAIVLWLR